MRAILLAALLASPALAQMPAMAPMATCERQAMVAGFGDWGKAGAADGLAVGRNSMLKLAPAETLGFTPPLARPAKPGTFGATFPLRIARAGSYRFAVSQGAWIDVVGDGKRLESAAHMPGPACSGIAKIVTFALQPGEYLVQLSEAKADAIGAMVVAGDGAGATATH